MSEGVNATAVSTVDSPSTTTTLECRDERESPFPSSSSSSVPPPPPPESPEETSKNATTATTPRKHRKHSTPAGTFLWIDGKKIRSALAVGKKWPPRPRRVSFPSNDTQLVTGYLEPANPWEHAENVNLEDLISSYKKSCERHCTEPLQNIITQLEKLDITDDERCAELCLKHEYLDQKHCEPLEEILKRVQFEKIDLEATSLDDESAVTLFDMLEYYESAKHLNMSSNRDIASRGWHACAHMIKKTACLEQLEARDIPLTQQHMNILKRPLQLVSHLHVLKLENCSLAGRAFAMLVSALKMNTGLRELYLADNGLEPDDAIQLGALLRVNNHLQLLDISNNHIKDEGVGDILDGLINQSTSVRDGKGLSILVLWNNDLTKSSSTHFTQAIAQSITLETLNIGKNCVSNELLEMAQDSLIQSRTLLQLGMQSTNLTCKGALLLADIVERNRTLQRIDLRDNNIQMTGLTALSFAMKKNTSITQLDLDEKPWSKVPATMSQYLELVAEIRGYCVRNEEPTSTDESTEESGSPQHRSRLSSVSSRKISLTCQTLPRSPPSMTPTTNEIGSRSMLEPKRTSGGRLRSPAPSPIPSPVASPIPSPSRSRFVVSRVSEASLSSTNSSASSSPITSPSLASSPTRFFPSTERGSSRFRVTVVEPSSHVPTAKSVVTSGNANVTIGFNYRIQTPESLDSDDSDSVFRPNVEQDSHTPGSESSANTEVDVNSEENGKATVAVTPKEIESCAEIVKIENKETTVTTTIATSAASMENQKTDEIEKKHEADDNEKIVIHQTDTTVKSDEQPSENGVVSNNIFNIIDNSIADCTKESREPEVALEKLVEPSNPEIIETKGNSTKRTEASLRDEIMACFQPESKKPQEPVQRQATSLERLLGLFQHPGSLFSGSTYSEKSESKNPLQDGVNSMIALGDKFQQYLREGRGSTGKTGTEDSPSHAPLQRSISDASRSTIKLDPVKSLSIPQLSSIQATCTRDFLSHKEGGYKQPANCTENVQNQTKPITDSSKSPSRNMLAVEEENPSDGSSEFDKNREPRIRDLPLPENPVESSGRETSENCVGTSEEALSAEFSDDGMHDRTDSATDIVSNAPLKVVSESKPTICAPKLKDIPEYSVLELARANAEAPDKSDVIRNTNGQVEMKCDSSTTDSINDPSCKNSSVCKVTCDMKYVANVHTLSTADDVHNFYNAPFSREIEMIIETPVECKAISVSSSTDDGRSVAIAIAVEVHEDANTIASEIPSGSMSSDRQTFSSEGDPISDPTKTENLSASDVETQPLTRSDSPTQRQVIVENNVDLLLPVLNNLCTNHLVDTESRDAQNDCVEETRFDNIATTTEDSQLSDTVEEFLPIDAAPLSIESSVVQRLNETVLPNKSVINNSIIDDAAATTTEHEFSVIATENYQENYSAHVNDSSVTVSVLDEKINSTIDETVGTTEAIPIPDEFVSFPNATRATDDFNLTKIDAETPTGYNYAISTAIEQVSTSLSEDSDYSSKLSVDDPKTGELSLNGSTGNSPGYDAVMHNVVETSIANNNLECTNRHSNEVQTTTEHRSFVRVAVESVLTSFVKVTDTSTQLSSSTVVNNSESTDDLIFKMTDIITADTASSSIVTTIEECGDASGLVDSYFEQEQSTRSPTNLVIDKSRNVHRNSQDSGIEETTVSISDDNGVESHGQPRDSFQESIDSGIDSECSSVCARIDLGSDVQRERARDPGNILKVETTINDDISIFPSNFLGKDGILSADPVVARIAANSTSETVVGIKKNPTRVTELISMGRCNETTEQSSVLVRSTSPE